MRRYADPVEVRQGPVGQQGATEGPQQFLWRGRLVYRITDFHPECLIAAQSRPSRALTLLLALTNFWRRRIDGFEVLGVDQRRRLSATCVPEERIALVRDGSPVWSADICCSSRCSS